MLTGICPTTDYSSNINGTPTLPSDFSRQGSSDVTKLRFKKFDYAYPVHILSVGSCVILLCWIELMTGVS